MPERLCRLRYERGKQRRHCEDRDSKPHTFILRCYQEQCTSRRIGAAQQSIPQESGGFQLDAGTGFNRACGIFATPNENFRPGGRRFSRLRPEFSSGNGRRPALVRYTDGDGSTPAGVRARVGVRGYAGGRPNLRGDVRGTRRAFVSSRRLCCASSPSPLSGKRVCRTESSRATHADFNRFRTGAGDT